MAALGVHTRTEFLTMSYRRWWLLLRRISTDKNTAYGRLVHAWALDRWQDTESTGDTPAGPPPGRLVDDEDEVERLFRALGAQ